jgi:hypothetical protein
MDRRRELLLVERAGWAELWELLESVGPDRADEPGYQERWSVKDLMAHIACWQAEAVQVLEQIRNGTFEPRDYDVDAWNERFFEANRDLPFRVVEVDLHAARTRMLQELMALPELTPDAEEWFAESGADHYAEHLPRLREWLQQGSGESVAR